MTTSGGVSATAIVHDLDGIRFLATAPDAEILLARLAGYVRGRCDDVLWADAAREVRRLLDEGDLGAGVALYFYRTGERWDRERLALLTAPEATCGPLDEERAFDARR